MDVLSLYKEILEISTRISKLSGLSHNSRVVEELDSLANYKDKIIKIEELVKEIDYQFDQVKQVVNFSKDLAIKSSKELLNFVSRQNNIYEGKNQNMTIKKSLVISNPVTETNHQITANTTGIVCVKLDKYKESKSKRLVQSNTNVKYIEKELASGGIGINIMWISDLEEYGVIINGKLLTGKLCDIVYPSDTKSNEHRRRHGFKNKLCTFSKKRVSCVEGCKFFHSDDIFFLKGAERYMNIGRKELQLLSNRDIISRDEFYKLEKRIVHDILVYEMLHKFFILKTIQ